MKSVGRGAAFGDYDNDGKIDVFLMNLGGPGVLLHNTSPLPGIGSAFAWWAGRATGTGSEHRSK